MTFPSLELKRRTVSDRTSKNKNVNPKLPNKLPREVESLRLGGGPQRLREGEIEQVLPDAGVSPSAQLCEHDRLVHLEMHR